MRGGQITSCTYSHSRVRVASGELDPQCAARTAAARTVARPPPGWRHATTVYLVQERAVASWSVGCLTWRVTSARRERPQRHRANPATNSSGTSVGAEATSTKDIGEQIKAHSRRAICVLEGGGHTHPQRPPFNRTTSFSVCISAPLIAFSRFFCCTQNREIPPLVQSAHERGRPQAPSLRTFGYTNTKPHDSGP